MMCFADGSGQAAYADTVAAHDGMLQAAVLVHIGHIHGLGVLGAQLEDVTYLNTAAGVDGGLAAYRADTAVKGLGHVHVFNFADIPGDVEADVVFVLLAGAGGQPLDALQGAVIYNGRAFRQAHRSGEAGMDAAVFGHDGGMHFSLQVVAQLGLIHVQVAADKHDHEGIVHVALVHHSLAGLLGLDLQEGTQVFNGLDVGGVHLFQRSNLTGLIVQQAGSRFHVGTVVAVMAQHDGVFAHIGQQHVFMAHLAAHHTAVAGHRHNLRHAAAGVDAVVGFVAAHIVLLQVFLGGVEGVGILHGELAHTDQAAAAAGFIPELRLDLVDHERILGIGVSHVRHQLDGSFLVGHTKHHIAAGTVLEPQQLRADGIIPAGLAPHICGHGNREQHFLSVDAVHLLADDVFDLRGNALGDGKQRKDAVAHGLDVAAAHHQCLAGNLTVRRSFLETLGYEISDLHKMTSQYFT